VQWLAFVVLAVAWGVALIPQWLADRRRDRPVESMASFHKRLWQLEQLDHSVPAPVPSYGYAADDDHESIGYTGQTGHDDDDTPGGVSGVVSRQALRRRRQVFFFLLTGVVGSLAALVVLRTLGAVVVHVSSLVLFTSYVTLLVRHHQRALEQASKVRYLSPIRAPRPAVVVLRSGTAR
jgi:hypothetical protein